MKTPLDIYLQRHSPLSPELWLHYSRLSARYTSRHVTVPEDMQVPDCLSRMYDVDDGGQEPTEPNNLILNLTGDLQEPPKMPTLVEVAEAQKTDKFCQTVLSDPRTIHGRDHLFCVDGGILCHRHRHLD